MNLRTTMKYLSLLLLLLLCGCASLRMIMQASDGEKIYCEEYKYHILVNKYGRVVKTAPCTCERD